MTDMDQHRIVACDKTVMSVCDRYKNWHSDCMNLRSWNSEHQCIAKNESTRCCLSEFDYTENAREVASFLQDGTWNFEIWKLEAYMLGLDSQVFKSSLHSILMVTQAPMHLQERLVQRRERKRNSTTVFTYVIQVRTSYASLSKKAKRFSVRHIPSQCLKYPQNYSRPDTNPSHRRLRSLTLHWLALITGPVLHLGEHICFIRKDKIDIFRTALARTEATLPGIYWSARIAPFLQDKLSTRPVFNRSFDRKWP